MKMYKNNSLQNLKKLHNIQLKTKNKIYFFDKIKHYIILKYKNKSQTKDIIYLPLSLFYNHKFFS